MFAFIRVRLRASPPCELHATPHAIQAIAAPEITEWKTALSALECSLKLEKTVNQSLLDLHVVASKHNDSQVSGFQFTFIVYTVHCTVCTVYIMQCTFVIYL